MRNVFKFQSVEVRREEQIDLKRCFYVVWFYYLDEKIKKINSLLQPASNILLPVTQAFL